MNLHKLVRVELVSICGVDIRIEFWDSVPPALILEVV